LLSAYYKSHRPFTSCANLSKGNYVLKCKFACLKVVYVSAFCSWIGKSMEKMFSCNNEMRFPNVLLKYLWSSSSSSSSSSSPLWTLNSLANYPARHLFLGNSFRVIARSWTSYKNEIIMNLSGYKLVNPLEVYLMFQ
jgi:hypothetical protein